MTATLLRQIPSVAALLAAGLALQPVHAAPRTATLVDQRGRPFTFAALRGHPLVVAFVAARCREVCPLVNEQFARAVQLAQNRHARTIFVTITLDPRHDTPAVMRDLARRFDADPRAWIFASGAAGDVRAVMGAFGVVTENDAGYPEMHSALVYVLSADGVLVRRFLVSSALDAQIDRTLR